MRITVFICLLFSNYLGLTQNADIGFSIGGSNYSGDLTETTAISIQQTHPCYGIHGRLELDPLISLKLQYMFLKVSGDDKYSLRPGNRSRQLNFESQIHEFSLLGQMQFLNFWSEKLRRWNPFLQFGLAVFRFNPQSVYSNRLVDLQPLGTEGQGMINFNDKYALTSFAFTMGFGIRFFFIDRFSLTCDTQIRKTFTDYLDDASTNYVSYDLLLQNRGKMAADLGNKIQAQTGTKRANPGDKDWYQSLVLTVSYHFGPNSKYQSRGIRRNQILCPRF